MGSILVVEDDAALRELFARVLRRAGFSVVAACDGLEAIAACEMGCFDVALVDLIMPRKEGLETILEIQRCWPTCRIVAVSGGGQIVTTDFLTLAIQFGAVATLRKPVSPAELVAAVREALAIQPPPAAEPPPKPSVAKAG